jgi:predicted ester cyclase
MSNEEHNKDVVKTFWEKAFGEGNLELADDILAANGRLISADDPTKVVPNPDGIKRVIQLLHEGLSDLQVTVKDQIAEGDKVVTVWEGRGNHTGEVLDIAPTRHEMVLHGISISRVSQDKIEDIVELSIFTRKDPVGSPDEMFALNWFTRHKTFSFF